MPERVPVPITFSPDIFLDSSHIKHWALGDDDWAPTASAVGELDLPAEWQWAPWTKPKTNPEPEHYVQVQMLCGGCESRMGLFMTMENTPDAMIVTCRCGFINVWYPR
jgi:hypothetical protein